MDNTTAVKPSRPRGRPPKMKRGGRKPTVTPISVTSQGGTLNSLSRTSASTTRRPDSNDASLSTSEDVVSDSPTTTATGSKRSLPDAGDCVPPVKRSRNNLTLLSHLSASNDSTSLSTPTEHKDKPPILPARRSTRHATMQSTQISEGTLRPPGPPNLEAALSIALRNLESETWRYLWAYHKKHPNGPLPTPAAVKEACSSVRIAAAEVDKADRDLEDAIDQIMLSNAKKKGRGGPRSGRLLVRSDAGMSNQISDRDASIARSDTVCTPENVSIDASGNNVTSTPDALQVVAGSTVSTPGVSQRFNAPT